MAVSAAILCMALCVFDAENTHDWHAWLKYQLYQNDPRLVFLFLFCFFVCFAFISFAQCLGRESTPFYLWQSVLVASRTWSACMAEVSITSQANLSFPFCSLLLVCRKARSSHLNRPKTKPGTSVV